MYTGASRRTLMKATFCAHHNGCRYQQDIVRLQKRYGVDPDACWAEEVKCDDQKGDMDKRCDQFRPLKEFRRLEMAGTVGRRAKEPNF